MGGESGAGCDAMTTADAKPIEIQYERPLGPFGQELCFRLRPLLSVARAACRHDVRGAVLPPTADGDTVVSLYGRFRERRSAVAAAPSVEFESAEE